MAIRVEIPERTPIDNVEVEYERASISSKMRKPGFNRVRLLAIRPTEIELATREAIPIGEKVTFTMHVKGVKNFVTAPGEVKKEPLRITVLKQPAFGVTIQIGKLSGEQSARMVWVQEQLSPRQRGPLRRDESSAVAAPVAANQAAPAASAPTATAEAQAPAETAPAPPEAAATVKRPVALLQLIEELDKFQVSDDVVLAVVEAAEAGLDVETLYATKGAEEVAAEKEEAEAEIAKPAEGVVRPLNVHRFAAGARLYFSQANVVIGPPSELIYLSRIKDSEHCFALEFGSDSMLGSGGGDSFRPGSILIFSTTAKVESGDFAYVKTRTSDDFAQVFIEKNEDLRLRPLNPQHREHIARHTEIQAVCKLIGYYEDLTGG